MSEIVVEKEIKSVTELQALANKQKREGKTDLAEFIVNQAPCVVADVVILPGKWRRLMLDYSALEKLECNFFKR